MAEHMIETRILLRYDTYSNWMNSNVILKIGEAAVSAFPRDRTLESLSTDRPENTPPAIGIKIGDGIHYFRELPWVQAISADVYTWAKQSNKPSYTAQEIQGLQSFVENIAGTGGDVTIAPRIYQLVQGTNENQNKYYLQYKENNEDATWVIDTSSYIDLENLSKIYNWLGPTLLSEYPTLTIRVADQIQYFINKLNYTDNTINNQFITSINETNGIISVERAQPNFSNLSGYATVSQGGTGHASLTENSVLVGNGTNSVKLIPIAESIENNNNLVPSYLVKSYVDNATAGITGAMHFIGESTVIITQNSFINPQIEGYNFSQAKPGDVILYDSKEFVWTGGYWRLLGDEGSYAIKGSITNADIAEDAEIDQSKIAGLINDLLNKVNTEAGKGLSSNDYTTEEKQKLEYIEENAQRNIIEHIYVNGTEVLPSIIENNPNSISFRVSALTPEEEEKISGIEAKAQVNKIEHIFLNNTELNIGIVKDLPKSVNITLNEFTNEEKAKLEEIEPLAQVNKIESIIINDTTYLPNSEKAINITMDEAVLKLELSRIAKTGNIVDILQNTNTYVILDCGSSTEVL